MEMKTLLGLFQLDEIPACEKGMELAKTYLEVCLDGVNRYGVEEPSDRLTEITAAYQVFVDHGADCDDCNEADPDPDERATADLADREIGFAAGLEGQECDETQTKAWQRGWADAQE